MRLFLARTLLAVFSHGGERERALVSSSLLIWVPALLDEGLTFMTSCKLNYLCTGPISQFSYMESWSYDLGIWGGTQFSAQQDS